MEIGKIERIREIVPREDPVPPKETEKEKAPAEEPAHKSEELASS